MWVSGSFRVAFLVGFLVLGGCGHPTRPEDLPAITMTSGGGFETSSQRWTIAPDGSWSWVRQDKAIRADELPSQKPPRSGRLTEAQRIELAALATAPALGFELSRDHDRCEISDGSTERLEVGSLRYVASWCPEDRPRIQQLRERIRSLTTGA